MVRGFCCLTPGAPGISDNIRICSVIGRFLEHSRIFYFRGGAENELDGKFFIGSADWMYRNLSTRVEVITPVDDRACRQRLWQALEILLSDQRQTWDMHADGTYTQWQPSDPAVQIGAQQAFIQLARQTGVDPRTFR
jgi:polyphosphate kinase